MTQQWKLVPINLLDEMIRNAGTTPEQIGGIYARLLAAAPTYELTDAEIERVAKAYADFDGCNDFQTCALCHDPAGPDEVSCIVMVRMTLETFLEDKR